MDLLAIGRTVLVVPGRLARTSVDLALRALGVGEVGMAARAALGRWSTGMAAEVDHGVGHRVLVAPR